MRRSTVQNLPLLLVFPALAHNKLAMANALAYFARASLTNVNKFYEIDTRAQCY
jgi:hypothetical protein